MGVKVSETTAEVTTAMVSVSANSRNMRPTRPVMNSSGMNTAVRETVSEITVKPISLAPRSAAWNGSSPFSMWRTMFSIMTMAASTTKPVPIVSGTRARLSHRKTAEPHDPEGRNQRQRQRDAGDDGGADGTQEDEHHGDDERHAQDQRELHVADRRADAGGGIVHHGERGADRHRALQFRQLVVDTPHRLYHVRAGLALDVDHDGGHALVKAGDLVFPEPIDDVCHV